MHGALALAALAVLAGHAAGQTCNSEGFGDDMGCTAAALKQYTEDGPPGGADTPAWSVGTARGQLSALGIPKSKSVLCGDVRWAAAESPTLATCWGRAGSGSVEQGKPVSPDYWDNIHWNRD